MNAHRPQSPPLGAGLGRIRSWFCSARIEDSPQQTAGSFKLLGEARACHTPSHERTKGLTFRKSQGMYNDLQGGIGWDMDDRWTVNSGENIGRRERRFEQSVR